MFSHHILLAHVCIKRYHINFYRLYNFLLINDCRADFLYRLNVIEFYAQLLITEPVTLIKQNEKNINMYNYKFVGTLL